MTRKIDWWGTFYITNMLTMIVLTFYEAENLMNCYITRDYCVWVCDLSFRLFVFILSASIFALFTFHAMIDLFCLKWDDFDEETKGDEK